MGEEIGKMKKKLREKMIIDEMIREENQGTPVKKEQDKARQQRKRKGKK